MDRYALDRRPCNACSAMNQEPNYGVSVGADTGTTEQKPAETSKVNPLWYWALGGALLAGYLYFSDSSEQALARHHR